MAWKLLTLGSFTDEWLAMHDETFPVPLLPHVEHPVEERSADSSAIFKLVVGGILSLLILALLVH